MGEVLDKSIIYYTDNRLDQLRHEYMLPELVRRLINEADLPIFSCSLRPLNFGTNVTLDMQPGVITMYKQIMTALAMADTRYVFFCEHDVLYHPSHFAFTPTNDDTFFYNVNVWRCHMPLSLCTTYDNMRSVSGICVNRNLAVEHYHRRLNYIYDNGFDKLEPSRSPKWARAMGWEPGKSPRQGAFAKDHVANWRSEWPNVDIRHRLTLTQCKVHVHDYPTPPSGWQECCMEDLPGWNLRALFNLSN